MDTCGAQLMRRACEQDAMKDSLKYMANTLRIWGYEHFSKVASKMFKKFAETSVASTTSIWKKQWTYSREVIGRIIHVMKYLIMHIVFDL